MTETPVAATGAVVGEIRVGSYNIRGLSNDPKAKGEEHVWRERRPLVAKNITSHLLDVIGLQEANQSNIYDTSVDYGTNQFLDLLEEIHKTHPNYALTNTFSYNCANSGSTYKCVYQDRGAAQDSRTLYNKRKVTLVRQGSVLYASQAPGKNPRYLDWSVFQSRATKQNFLFTNTHLDPYNVQVRQNQWDESIAITDRLKGGMPVVAVGDYNTSKWATYAGKYIPAMKNAGYGDVADQQAGKTHALSKRPEVLKRGWVNSYNAFKRDVRAYSYEDERTKIGNGIDWIFASNELRVKKWEVVVNMDANLMLRGIIPSDHNLVWANLVIS